MLEVKREFLTQHAGQTLVVAARDLKPSTTLTFVCDGPRCEARNGKPLRLSWIEEEAMADASCLPNEFFGIVKLQPFPTDVEKVFFFCGPACTKDWLSYSYEKPKTAKEVRDELKALKEAQAIVDTAQRPLPFEPALQTGETR
jgi:hypothetical protein